MTSTEVTVHVVDDDEGIRRSLSMLARTVGLNTKGYASADAFLKEYDEAAQGGCLVLDIRMPGMSGLELQRELATLGSTLPIIFITGHGDVPMAVEAVKAGAVDFVQKPFRDQDLLDRIQEALDLGVRRRQTAEEQRDVEARISRLTPREREVLALVVDGLANKVIASDLGLSERTVEIHRSHVMRKMEAESLAHLVRMVILSRI